MTSLTTQHCCATRLPTSASEQAIFIHCHRYLRGPYSGGSDLMRTMLASLTGPGDTVIAMHGSEVYALAPDVGSELTDVSKTLTNSAMRGERTRYYSAARTLRLAHGVAEMLTEWATRCHPEGTAVAFLGLDEADFTDRELVATLVRRCDPAVVRILVEAADSDDVLGLALAAYAIRIPAGPRPLFSGCSPEEAAQRFIDSDGTLIEYEPGYLALPAGERARKHTERANYLAAIGSHNAELGAIPFHRERGESQEAAITAISQAVDACFDRGYYHAVLDLAERGRQLFGERRNKTYWNLTNKAGACLSYLRPRESFAYFAQMRLETTDPAIHMNTAYMLAMLYTRHLPKAEHDEDTALAWCNTAIALADLEPDPHRRAFHGAFMRNARALVELHRGKLDGALRLVNEGIAITNTDLGPYEQLLHRSVLLFNRAQILAAQGLLDEALADYDEVIDRDPAYGDYYFERAGVRRSAGRPQDALADYAAAIRLSPPFREAHFNRADLLRELGDDDAALTDLDYGLVLDPDHVDGLINRTDILLARGEVAAALTDINHGLAIDPGNPHLLCARGSCRQDSGDLVEAQADYSAAIEHDPTFVAGWANRAVLAYETQNFAAAVDDLDRALELRDDVALRINRAIVLQDVGNHRRALADLNHVLAQTVELDPEVLYRRGLSRWELSDEEGARDDWRHHLSAYPAEEDSPFASTIRQLLDKESAPAVQLS